MENPNYYSIIPANVRYDKTLKANEKLLYSEISALSNKSGYCSAKNSYFAGLYNVDKTTISRWISNLNKLNYIKIKYIYKNKEIVSRRIYLQLKQDISIDENINTPIDENINTSIDEKVKDNITSIEYKEEEKENKEKVDEVVLFYEQNFNLMSPIIYESLNAYRNENLKDDLIIAVLKDAVFRNKKTWKYIDSILRDCRNNNIFTSSQFEIKQKEFKEQCKLNKAIKHQNELKGITYNTDFSEYDIYAKKRTENSE